MNAGDHLVAPTEAVARRRAERLTLTDCLRAFLRRPSPWVFAAALTAALVARVLAGHWSWRDPVVAVAIVAAQPFTEWLLHVYVLHSKPIRVGGRTFDLPAAREHREHHAAPADLDGVLVPAQIMALVVPLIALVGFGLGFALHPLLGGDRIAVTLSGIVTAYAMLSGYEWCHFLIHSPYIPRGRYYKAIRRSHRLHHYKNERYWFGVTSNLGDQVLSTYPDAAEVPRSATARALHQDASPS